MDPITNMLVLDGLTKKSYSPKEWLQYYKNVWGRNVIARTVDVKTDRCSRRTTLTQWLKKPAQVKSFQ